MDVIDQNLQRVFNNLHDGLYCVDNDRVIIYWNKAAELISGFTAEEVIGRCCSDSILTHVDENGHSLCNALCPLAETIEDDVSREATIYMHHKDGHRIPVSVRVSTLKNDFGVVVGGIELFTDISNVEADQLRLKELEKLALLDNLTQLANRHYLDRELTSRLEEFERYGVLFGVLLMDIDHFKNVNDTYGHDVGDEILKCVANTLIKTSRPFDLYGRWGGEEFVGLVRNVAQSELQVVAERVLVMVENSYVINGGEKLSVTISIGATLVTKGDTIKSLLKRADNLLYLSKGNGRNQVTYSMDSVEADDGSNKVA
jgi:diguanylate cyclase (GGDEF)-like protein/PAS domain S-box-containing protein